MTDHKHTERMRAILAAAAGEAQALNQEYIGTEHLLLAMLAARESCAATALRNLGVDLAKAANRVLSIVQRDRTHHSHSSVALLPLTSRTKKVLELAAEEADALKHSYLGTEHLLLGLLAEGKGLAAGVLFESGVGLASARAEVLRILGVTSDHDEHATHDAPPNEPPSRIAIVLEYANGPVLSKHFSTKRDAIAFLQAE